MRKLYITTSVLISMMFFIVGGAWAETFEGSIVGFNCLINKDFCPTEGSSPEMDPHTALEPDRGLHRMRR